MMKLMIFVDWFVPGYKGGGQIRSCANLAYALKDRVNVSVVTGDRDLGDETQYPDVKIGEWNELSAGLEVLYLSPAERNFRAIKRIINERAPDCIYLNSMFSVPFTLYPLLASGKDRNVVLAPRGMLQKGALQFKKIKKNIFFAVFKMLKLHHRIHFHATDATEASDIRDVFGDVSVSVVNDFPEVRQEPIRYTSKTPGALKCLFVSRISPKKNLLYLLEVMKTVKAHVTLTIAGPAESEAHWMECKQLIDALPPNISVAYKGPVPHHLISALYLDNHLFALTTFGENFGHVIFESFLYGRPVLISDTTPWKNLQLKKLGWDCKLSEKNAFAEAIEEAAKWNQETFNAYCDRCWNFASQYLSELNLKDDYMQLFEADQHPVELKNNL